MVLNTFVQAVVKIIRPGIILCATIYLGVVNCAETTFHYLPKLPYATMMKLLL